MRKLILILILGSFLLATSGSVWAREKADSDPIGNRTHWNRYEVEFSTYIDHNAVPGALNVWDPEQVLYTEPPDPPGPPEPKDIQDFGGDGEADALANYVDAWFVELLGNSADLLVSFEGDPATNCVYVETPAGGRGVRWTHFLFDSPGAFAVNDGPPDTVELDGLQLWGEDTGNYGNQYSLLGDPVSSVRWYDPGTGATGGYVPHADIVWAVHNVPYLPWTGLDSDIDLDALMCQDNAGLDTTWDVGDEIIFSVRADPAGSPPGWDGGEILHLAKTPAGLVVSYLTHGGHIWDTPFDVATAFGVATDEVDAIEADYFLYDIPSHTNLGILILTLLLLLAGAYVIYQRRRSVLNVE